MEMETPPHALINQLRRTTRSALTEIPARIGALTFSDLTPGTRSHPHIYTTVNNQANLVNIPPSYVSPSPSPDELVIQQRGRRKVPVTFSPDTDFHKWESAQINKDRTPVKNSPGKSQIVLRSTPRKRLVLSEPKELCLSPDKKKVYSPNAKKMRLELTLDPNSPVETALKGLSSQQLIGIIQGLIKKHPDLEQEIKDTMPAPDLCPLEERLNDLKRNIYKSLPNSRLTSKTDSPAYSRAAIHVLAFKKYLLEQGRQLVDAQQWPTVIEYVQLAWAYTRATPNWDNPPHNAARRQCFKSLAAQCMGALKHTSFEPEVYDDLYTRMESFSQDNEDFGTVLKYIDSRRVK